MRPINYLKQNPWVRLMRFDKPIGIYLLLWPTYWGLWFASNGQPSLKNLIIFTLGVIVMRAAGCVINDYADRHVDGSVDRTKHRPIPAGEIKPTHGLTLFLALIVIALFLVLQTNPLTIKLAVVGVFLAATYPFLKRLTQLPQLGLGMAWAWAVPMAFAAEQQALPASLWLISGAIVLWTIAFDTYYAMADREEDLKIGIKSTAILFGKQDLLIIAVLQVLTLILLATAGNYFNRGWIYDLSLIIAAGYFVSQHLQARARKTEGCFKAFLNNHRVGMAVFIGLALDYSL
ncbi:MAG: 4-hydroxybenzoate octaprenyltransferase [Cellvibrionales bacterium TMED47]|nr:4-hydroxybenzoate octaprenyltransferase [Porticoccaceae bacterium]RPG82168.1 MAG: 4-hydroxybenzoate octaprenyltransferase [Cellvibrionales bacterium TMED47]|tara:strand:- start:29774 stop:30640 length:867 start_codon:yes stop_codon:yes gene_type:complete